VVAPGETGAPADAPPVYRVRPNIFVKERTYSLEPDALVWTDGRTTRRVPYSDVRRVHVYSMPPTFAQDTRRTILKGRFRRVMISATHYRGLGRTHDRSATYFPFVSALLERVAAKNPAVVIMVGQSWPLYVLWVLLLFLTIFVVALAAVQLVAGAFEPKVLPALVILLMLLPASWRIARYGRPRRARPDALEALNLGRLS